MPNPEQQKRTLPEKTIDVTFSAISVVTLPLWLTAGFGAATTRLTN